MEGSETTNGGNRVVSLTGLAHAPFPLRRRPQAKPSALGSAWGCLHKGKAARASPVGETT